MRLKLSEKAYIRDIKVCLELRQRNHRQYYGKFGDIDQELCDTYPVLDKIKKLSVEISEDLKKCCSNICTEQTIELKNGWFITWGKDCYFLCYTREKGSGHKDIGCYSKYNLGFCFIDYINWVVNKSDCDNVDDIVNMFNDYHEIIKEIINSHPWEELEKPEAAKPKVINKRGSGGGGMKIFAKRRK